MMFKKTLLAAAVFAVGGFAMTASAASTTQFDVKINITSVCSIVDASGAAAPIDFGSVASNVTTAQTKNNTLSVTCSKNTPYSIGLTTVTGAAGAGLMLPTDSQVDTGIPYTLYQPGPTGTGITATAWGDSGALAGTQNWHGTGNGGPQSVSVYATVLGTQLNHAPGNYKDTVTVNVYL